MRLLILTHTFPPSTHSNAKRPYYVAKGFLKAGWQVDVVTSPLAMPRGAAETVTHPALRVVRRSDPIERLRLSFPRHPRFSQFVLLAVSGLLWPDRWVVWVLKSLCAMRGTGGYDRTLVFLQPPSLLLTGLLRNRFGPRCIYDFQEALTPYLRSQGRHSPLQRVMLGPLERLERRACHRAGRVIFTAETNRRTYIQAGLTPEQSTVHIPYFYDAEEFQSPAQGAADRFEIVYLGTFDWRGDRSPETFLRSLAGFLKRCPEARATTRFVFHGTWQSVHDRHLDELELRDIASLGKPLGYQDYLNRLRRSPVLLLVVAAAHNLFMPSKIVDYFGARRPILSFVPRASEMRRVLETAGMAEYACDPTDVEAGAAALDRLWRRFRAGQLTGDDSKGEFWSSETQMPRYLEAVRSAGQRPQNEAT